ncbi:hypothetical protein C1J03_12335 [Sulfitobacter sp. SK012]|uniref:hypothetical protein n=1 Tax=Sulfitobacter sp. SK012 TaxID=1389005 RepID=UPI000E0CBD7F|nr:hypothetical protein [Sulfitobacter sp. SK012]AXI46739.1 hypothetical protein C1J03_12335 [Sulfitobacter sp. SK012]
MKINTRNMVLAWLCALCAALVGATAVLQAGQRQLETRLAPYDTVFLGTSLMRYALPVQGDGRSIQAVDANSALRIGLSRGSEADLLDLTQAAVNARVATTFIEINPIVSRFSDRHRPCSLWNGLNHRRGALRQAANAVLRGGDIIVGNEPAKNDRLPSVDLERLAELYPLQFDVPCHPGKWQQIPKSSGSSKIVLVAMPRSEIAKTRIGPEGMIEFDRAAIRFASQLNLPLFMPDSDVTWSEDHFLDQAHMSQLGSERFLQELGQWWDAQK